MLTVGVSASLKPFPSVYIAAGADVSFDASDMGYNGIQVAGSLSWQLASDVSLAASAVHFFASENGSSATDIKVLAFVSF